MERGFVAIEQKYQKYAWTKNMVFALNWHLTFKTLFESFQNFNQWFSKVPEDSQKNKKFKTKKLEITLKKKTNYLKSFRAEKNFSNTKTLKTQ